MRLSCVTMITARSPSMAIVAQAAPESCGRSLRRAPRSARRTPASADGAPAPGRSPHAAAGRRKACPADCSTRSPMPILREQLLRLGHCFPLRIALDHQRHRRVLGRRQRRQQIELLKHEADVVAAKCGPPPRRQLRQIGAERDRRCRSSAAKFPRGPRAASSCRNRWGRRASSVSPG